MVALPFLPAGRLRAMSPMRRTAEWLRARPGDPAQPYTSNDCVNG